MASESAPSTFTPLVLIVEDDPVNQRLLAEVCRHEGYLVKTANDGEEAFRLFFHGDVDVLLVDAAMPRMDGFTLAKLVRGMSSVPVIMVTASLEHGVRERAIGNGVTAFVSKPFRIYELTRQLRSVLAQQVPPSERPGGGYRKRFAGVLDRLGTSLPLRAALGRALRSTDGAACLVLRLDNEQDVVSRMGRTAKDALLGFAGHVLEKHLGNVPLYWADSNELATVVSRQRLDELVLVADRVLDDVSGFGIDGVTFHYGAVRFSSGESFDPDDVLRATRHAVDEAARTVTKGVVENLREQRDSSGPV